jgi:hypothetical protein
MGRGKAAGDHWLGRIVTALDVDEEEMPDSAPYPGGSVTILWHDAGGLIGYESEKTSTDSLIQEQSQPATTPSASETDYEMFPLIRPLTS